MAKVIVTIFLLLLTTAAATAVSGEDDGAYERLCGGERSESGACSLLRLLARYSQTTSDDDAAAAAPVRENGDERNMAMKNEEADEYARCIAGLISGSKTKFGCRKREQVPVAREEVKKEAEEKRCLSGMAWKSSWDCKPSKKSLDESAAGEPKLTDRAEEKSRRRLEELVLIEELLRSLDEDA